MSFLEDKECITADEIKLALNLIPEEIKTEQNVKWFEQIFRWEQLCHDINVLGAIVDTMCKNDVQRQYYNRLLGKLSELDFKHLLSMVYNNSVKPDDMLDSYGDKIFHSHQSYSFFGLMCLIIKTIKTHRNEHNVRIILNKMYPLIFLSPEQVKLRLEEIKRRQLLEEERRLAFERRPFEQYLSAEQKEERRQHVDAEHALMIRGDREYDGDSMGQSRSQSPDQYYTADFKRPPPPSRAKGGSRRRRRTAHRKRKSHRKSKRVHHTRRKHTRRHRHSRRH
jgi:hypothetical protein